MNDSRAKYDMHLFQMETFRQDIAMQKESPAVDVDLTGAKLAMTIRQKNGQQILATFVTTDVTTPPAYVEGEPMKGAILLDATKKNIFTLLMSPENTAHACPDGKDIIGVYDIIYTPTGEGALAESILYGEIRLVASPSRPV